MPNLTAELFSRVVEVVNEVFGEGRVEVTPHPDEYPPQVEFGNVWISPPDEDCTTYTWGTQHYHPGTTRLSGDHDPPETDVEEKGTFDKMDDAIKAAVVQHVTDMLDDKFLAEWEDSMSDESDYWEND